MGAGASGAVHLSLIAERERQVDVRRGSGEHSDESDVFTNSVVQCSKLGG